MTKKEMERKIEALRRMVGDLDSMVADCEDALEQEELEDAESFIQKTVEMFKEFSRKC